MPTTLKDLRERRGRLVAEMRGLLDAASAEARDLTAEQQGRYDEMFAEQERLGAQVAREERQQDLDRRMAENAARGDAAAAQRDRHRQRSWCGDGGRRRYQQDRYADPRLA